MPRDTNLPEDISKRAVNRAHNEAMWAQKQKEKAQSVACRAAKERGEDTTHNPSTFW
jgi:hypothetical protein